MAERSDGLLVEARQLGLFRQHGAFEVHCSNCHARLDGRGDCPSCGLIGRSEEALRSGGEAAMERLLETQIARRRAYRPVKAGARD